MAKVKSQDGTLIAYERAGSGPALILVDGALCSRALGPMKGLVSMLSKDFTVIRYDRRGRNESGDAPSYSVQKEIEDIEALIREAGGSAMLFGLSSGAALVLKAVDQGLPVSKIALYEPPFYTDLAGSEKHLKHKAMLASLLSQEQRSEALHYFHHQVIGLPAFLGWIFRLTPMWSKMKAVAPTLNYDFEVLGDGLVPVELISRLKQPTIVIAGEKTAEFLRTSSAAVAKALPGSELVWLKGQSHNVSAKALAPVLRKFLLGPARSR